MRAPTRYNGGARVFIESPLAAYPGVGRTKGREGGVRPDMSEFTYGFALTSELVWWSGVPFVALPVFPALIFEGAPGGGWDVQIARPTIRLFLQFKISD